MKRPRKIIHVNKNRIACNGTGFALTNDALGHPKVYLQLDEDGKAECGYCDRVYILSGSDADRIITSRSV